MTERPSLPQSRYVRGLGEYPFADLDRLRAETEAAGVEVIDLGMGDPMQAPPAVAVKALHAAVGEVSSYPRAAGLPVLREAAAAWCRRRFGVTLDPAEEVLPVNGSKEAIFTLPLLALETSRPLVLVPDPGYPVYALGTQAAGGEVYPVPLRRDGDFLPDLEAVPREVWERTSVLWLNYPHNPTGASAPRDFWQRAVERCRRHGVLLASDEAYSEIYQAEPPSTALAFGLDNVLVVNTLSKRSGMPGFRSGFMAGDRRVIAAQRRMRPALGVGTPQFIQAAAAAAWSDEQHVNAIRATYAGRRERAVPVLAAAGYDVYQANATFYLWVAVPAGERAEDFCARAVRAGVAVLPGTAMGPGGAGYFRVSLTADDDRLEEALARIARLSV